MTTGICTHCSCTEHNPCSGGCAWTDDDRTVCTQCAAAVDIASELVKILGAVAAHPKAGIRLATARWELLPPEQQRTLVMTMRATVDGIRQALLDQLTEEAVVAAIEFNAIQGFLLERCPHELERDEERLSDVVMRLLDPHVGGRIVMPGGVRT